MVCVEGGAVAQLLVDGVGIPTPERARRHAATGQLGGRGGPDDQRRRDLPSEPGGAGRGGALSATSSSGAAGQSSPTTRWIHTTTCSPARPVAPETCSRSAPRRTPPAPASSRRGRRAASARARRRRRARERADGHGDVSRGDGVAPCRSRRLRLRTSSTGSAGAAAARRRRRSSWRWRLPHGPSTWPRRRTPRGLPVAAACRGSRASTRTDPGDRGHGTGRSAPCRWLPGTR